MPSRPTVLLILSFPVGVVAYTVAAQVLTTLQLDGIIVLLAPLFVAGLCMFPFLVPFFDRKAKQDLAAYRRAQASVEEGSGSPGDHVPPDPT